MVKVVYRYLLFIFGFVNIVLGILGVILPIVPGFPFFILALWCFDRSSPIVHRGLLSIPYLGAKLRDWDKHKKIEKKRKQQLYLIVLLSFCVSISSVALFPGELPVFKHPYLLQCLLITIMLIILFFISRIDEK